MHHSYLTCFRLHLEEQGSTATEDLCCRVRVPVLALPDHGVASAAIRIG